MSPIPGGDRQQLVVEAMLDIGRASQTAVEMWVFRNPDTAFLLGTEHATRERVNSWVATTMHRMRKRGIIEVVGKSPDVQRGHEPANLYGLAEGICHHCGRRPLGRRPALERR